MQFITDILGDYEPFTYFNVCPETGAVITMHAVNFGYILNAAFIFFAVFMITYVLKMLVKGLFYGK
jgi:hypothetical protein